MVFQGTLSVNHTGDEVIWEEYEFLCKPGALDRRPCLISPYHYRLDWLMWFAAFQVKQREETLCIYQNIVKIALFTEKRYRKVASV